MDAVLNIVSHLGNPRYEEDKIDWANYQLTAYMFAISSILVTTYTYMGAAIKCWTPAEFRPGWNEYARDYCLIENTYYVAIDNPEMPDHKYREEQEISYYQWVPFVLVILAFLWHLPHLFWRSFNWWSGIQVRAIITAVVKLDEKKREEGIDKLADHIYRCVFERRRSADVVPLKVLYLVMKFLFLFNIVLQIIILHIFLGFNWIDLLKLRLGFNSDWKSTGLFPRTTMCDFSIRNKGNIQHYSVQCVLAQNMFNEKIFLVLFYWILILFAVTLANTILWAKQIFLSSARASFVKRMLGSAGISEPKIDDFGSDIKEYDAALSFYKSFIKLSGDCVVLFRLIASNAGDAVTSNLMKRLFDKAREKKNSQRFKDE